MRERSGAGASQLKGRWFETAWRTLTLACPRVEAHALATEGPFLAGAIDVEPLCLLRQRSDLVSGRAVLAVRLPQAAFGDHFAAARLCQAAEHVPTERVATLHGDGGRRDVASEEIVVVVVVLILVDMVEVHIGVDIIARRQHVGDGAARHGNGLDDAGKQDGEEAERRQASNNPHIR